MFLNRTYVNGVGFSFPNMNNGFVCSKVRNFAALFGVSARIGGKIPKNVKSKINILTLLGK